MWKNKKNHRESATNCLPSLAPGVFVSVKQLASARWRLPGGRVPAWQKARRTVEQGSPLRGPKFAQETNRTRANLPERTCLGECQVPSPLPASVYSSVKSFPTPHRFVRSQWENASVGAHASPSRSPRVQGARLAHRLAGQLWKQGLEYLTTYIKLRGKKKGKANITGVEHEGRTSPRGTWPSEKPEPCVLTSLHLETPWTRTPGAERRQSVEETLRYGTRPKQVRRLQPSSYLHQECVSSVLC